MAEKNTFQEQQVDAQTVGEEYLTLIKDHKVDVTSIGQYNIDFQSKVTVPRGTSKRVSKYETAAHSVYIHFKTHERNIKALRAPRGDLQLALKTHKGDNGRKTPEGDNHVRALFEGKNKTLRRGHDKYLTPMRDDDNAPYGDRKILLIEIKTKV